MLIGVRLDYDTQRVVVAIGGIDALPLTPLDATTLGLRLLRVTHPDKAGQMAALFPDDWAPEGRPGRVSLREALGQP
jgi:hypothetical protein